MWLKKLLSEMGSKYGEAVTLIVDNVSAVNLAKNPISMGETSILR